MKLDRFDREADVVPTLENAAQELRASIELQVREIVGASEARAAEIEQEALGKARDIERAAETLLSSAVERASVLLEAIDSAESGFAGTIASLRADAEALLAELKRPPQALLPVESNGNAAVPRAEQRSRVPDDSQAHELFREQLLNMYFDGTPRDEVERFITRFEPGNGYLRLLDEIYGPSDEGSSPAQEVGLLQRIRRRAGPSSH